MAITAWAFAGPALANDLGQRLFAGDAPVSAHLRHAKFQLPGAASACRNCHGLEGTLVAADSVAPALGPDHLLSPRKRGAGPPVAYDQAGFCRVLTTGRTPAHTVVPREMPLFQVTSAECAALWAYLTEEQHAVR